MKNPIYLLLLLFLCPFPAKAQNLFGLLQDGPSVVSAGLNANPNLNVNLDYLYAFKEKDKTLQCFGVLTQANFPLFSQKRLDVDLRIGVGALIGISRHFKVLTGLIWNLSRTEDLNGRYLHSGIKLDLLPGYYSTQWVVAPHLSLSYQPFINIKHNDYAKKAFQDLYPGGNGPYHSPKNGWFYQNNLQFRSGIGIAFIQPQWQMNLTAGFQHQPNHLGLVAFPDIGMMPFYGEFNLGYSIIAK